MRGVLQKDFPAEQRRRWLFMTGICLTMLFHPSARFNFMVNRTRAKYIPLHVQPAVIPEQTKYPPSLHFLLMTMVRRWSSWQQWSQFGNRFASP